MISAATGAMAILMVGLVRDHGIEYLFAATILTGIIQFIFGALRLGRYLRFVPKAVMVGFVNSLAIVIFQAQLTQFTNTHWSIYPLGIGRSGHYLPVAACDKSNPVAPGRDRGAHPLYDLYRQPIAHRGRYGRTAHFTAAFMLPNVPFTWETMLIILPYALPLALVGLIESLLTANIVDDMTDTTSDKNREARGQGIANFITGFFGGMAGCAMIGQSVSNVSSDGRSRLSKSDKVIRNHDTQWVPDEFH